MNEAKLHELYVDAIAGIDLTMFSLPQQSKMEKEGLAKFVGNQHNPEWQWNREALAQLNSLQLEHTYAMLKALQTERGTTC